MLSRIVLLALGMLLAGRASADDNAPSPAQLCHQEISVGRSLWLHDLYDAPPAVSALMVDVIDGKLPQVHQKLKAMPPADATRWRQSALLTAVFAGQSAMVHTLLNDGAAINDTGWLPALKPDFFGQTVNQMKHDPTFGSPETFNRLTKAGVLSNQGQSLGPALIDAVRCGDVATVDVLLSHHADVAARWVGADHRPVGDALLEATVQGDAAIVQRLLDHGADPCLDDRYIQSHKPGASLAAIGKRNGLPAALTQKLRCAAIAAH